MLSEKKAFSSQQLQRFFLGSGQWQLLVFTSFALLQSKPKRAPDFAFIAKIMMIHIIIIQQDIPYEVLFRVALLFLEIIVCDTLTSPLFLVSFLGASEDTHKWEWFLSMENSCRLFFHLLFNGLHFLCEAFQFNETAFFNVFCGKQNNSKLR